MSKSDQSTAFAAAREAMIAAYCSTLSNTRMNPVEALECIASALGAIYREVADEHLHPAGCPCGWQPDDLCDVLAMQQAIAANAARDERIGAFDLRLAPPVGHG